MVLVWSGLRIPKVVDYIPNRKVLRSASNNEEAEHVARSLYIPSKDTCFVRLLWKY